MQFATLLLPFHEMLISTWDKNNYICFSQPCSIPPIDKLTLCSLKDGIYTLTVTTLALGLRPRQRGCKVASQERDPEVQRV
jgi:hypothetical protein